ncbi:peptide deformylase [Nitrosophilus labii]|uniref:peptide deformylase n=1 Tax=Nitrosophilus labii TaxID=2706014 RepID=UPI0016569DF7|nr:peptide deformylase [Nitrosophilus labii]
MAKILTYPDKTLLQISGLVRDFNDISVKETIEKLKKTIEENNIKGLSAIQIGIPKRIIVFKDKNQEFVTMINPAIFGKSGKLIDSTESDESLPDIEVTVKRYDTIKIMYQDIDKNDKFLTVSGDEAIFLQRKIDMAYGGYLFDKLDKKKQKEFFKQYGSYGDTCPSYFVKDKIIKALRYTLTLHTILLVASLFFQFAKFVITYKTPIFILEFAWVIFYALYAKYETQKYKNCTSCQGANIFGTSAIYLTIIFTIYIIALFL